MTRTRRSRAALAAALLAACAGAQAAHVAPARAWEAQTTHAGLTEQAALAADLHGRLVGLGFAGGLYEPLTVPPADAPELLASLARYAPTGGFVPDQRGRQFAVGWLVAGAALADSSPAWAIHHFFDPTTGRGAHLETRLFDRIRAALAARAAVPSRGLPAPDWVVAADNPLGLAGFHDQYAKAVRAATPGERARHLAGALVAAGAVLHVLQDMGSPSHVRDDVRAHLDRVGPARDDLGSRFERIAALAYGRLGVPSAAPVARPTLRAFFTADDGHGLADVTAASWFSASTLPRDVRIGAHVGARELATRLTAALVRPAPALPARLNLIAAQRDEGATVEGPGRACLVRYRVERGVLRFSTDDACMLSQVEAILPRVVGYGAGLLQHLFRGALEATRDPGAPSSWIVATPIALGPGQLEVLAEDDRGVRAAVTTVAIPGGEAGPLATVAAPAGARALVLLFTGVDAAGEPLVAAGVQPVAGAE